jgi:hypothetical protein
MKQLFTLSVLLLFSFAHFEANAQFTLTDEMNLGEDRSSHNYQEYSPSGSVPLSMGFYDCNGDSAVNIGAGGVNDSITFDLAVDPNSDVILIRWKYAWFNSGSTENEFPLMVIEDTFEESMVSPSPSSIGSHPFGCALDSHMIYLTSMSAFTADGSIKIKVYDPYPSFAGNSSLSRVNAYVSEGNVGINENLHKQVFSIYPNPFTNSLTITINTSKEEEYNVKFFDVLGKEYNVTHEISSAGKLEIDTRHLPDGIYFVFIQNSETSERVYSQKIIKN